MINWWNRYVAPSVGSDIADAIRDRHISMGPVTEELEQRLGDLLGAPHVVVTTSGSTALLLALMSCNVGPDDEVIVPARTFVATAHAPLMLGATVRLVDVQSDKPLLNCEALEAAMSEKTKAILPVHRNGRAADMTRIREVAQEYGLIVIEDAAQALFSAAESGLLGAQGDLGCFSMGMTKLITTGQGGFVATHNADLRQRLRALRNHGSIDTDSWTHREMGFNFKFTDLLAAMAIQQLNQVDAAITRMKLIYTFYLDAIKDLECVEMLDVDVESGELPLWIEALSPKRDQVIRLLAEHSISAKAFPPSLNDLPYLQGQGAFPNSEHFARQGFILPSGPALSDQELAEVADALREIDRILK